MKKIALFLLMLALIPAIVFAQWSDDAMENLAISDQVNYNIIPKIVMDPEGNTYISWFSAVDLNYNVWLQRLDRDGNNLWAENGILISNKPTMAWVTNFSMILDDQNNAVIANQDERTGSSNAYAWRTSTDGYPLWDSDGITLSNSENFNPYPKMVETDDGDFVFCFDDEPWDTTQITKINLQKVSPDGTVLWGEGVTIEHDSLNYWFSHLTLTSEGDVMVSFLETPLVEDLPFGAQLIDYVNVQKVDMNGNLLWENPVRVDTGDCLYYPDMYIVPFIAPDEEGGAYVCWFTSLYPPVPSSSIFVQRVKADGTLGFVDGPANVSVNEQNEHWEPAICKLPGDPNFYVFWREFHYDYANMMDQIGVYGQKISPTGQRMWGEEAKA
ncbi:hypothetical protein KA005_31595, partial [bacterium]|nr:hypothetical protein [bacterium]